MASARIDPATLMRMVSTLLDEQDSFGAAGGTIPIAQMGEDDPDGEQFWCRFLGFTYAGRQRQRSSSTGADEPDTGSLQVRLGIFCTTEGRAAAIASVSRVIYQVFDERTYLDPLDNTNPLTTCHHITFQRPTLEINDDPDPERGLRVALMTINAIAERQTGTTTEDFHSTP